MGDCEVDGLLRDILMDMLMMTMVRTIMVVKDRVAWKTLMAQKLICVFEAEQRRRGGDLCG